MLKVRESWPNLNHQSSQSEFLLGEQFHEDGDYTLWCTFTFSAWITTGNQETSAEPVKK